MTNYDSSDMGKKPEMIPAGRVAAYYADISGPGAFGRPKARVMLRYYNLFADGSEQEFQSLVMEKPALYIFQHGDYVNVRLDFNQSIDYDLRDTWQLLEDYSQPINSVDYTPEELEQGFYVDDEGQHMVYYPMVDITISPIGKEDQYVLSGMNPAFYTLQPRDLQSGPCVVQLTFHSEYFVVNAMPDIDMEEIRSEVAQDLGFEA